MLSSIGRIEVGRSTLIPMILVPALSQIPVHPLPRVRKVTLTLNPGTGTESSYRIEEGKAL